MQLILYADINQLTHVGEIQILYDRIVYIDLKIPLLKMIKAKTEKRKPPAAIHGYKAFCGKTAFPFMLQKLSKADIPFRELRLTHKLVCSEIGEDSQYQYFVKLKALQCLQISYHMKQFFWQSADFKTKLYQSIIGYVVPLILAALFFLFAKKTSVSLEKKSNQINKENVKIIKPLPGSGHQNITAP